VAISEKTLKLLWGRGAGRCSAPGCNEDCTPYLDPSAPTVLGEMAHVIAREPLGPRGIPNGGSDEYQNLILLCPTCHRKVDKAPQAYPETLLLSWKESHEKWVSEALSAPRFETAILLFREIARLLLENKVAWQQFGPESAAASSNPASSAAEIWTLRKLAKIVPNNRRIVRLLAAYPQLLPAEFLEQAAIFSEHAEAFEQNCFNRREDVPRFPQEFEKLVKQYVQ
jgi:hypothetical protein